MSYCEKSFQDRSWQSMDIASELQGFSGVASATPTITIQTNRPVLLGRLELVYDETATEVTFPTAQSLAIGSLPLFGSVNGGSAAQFLPDSPGLVDNNYLGVALLPGQTLRIAMAASVNASVSARVITRPLTRQELEEVQSGPAFTPGFRFLYGLPLTTIGAGATANLTMSVERGIEPGYNLGSLVLQIPVATAFFGMSVNSISVAGVPVDAEVTAAAVDWRHYSHTNARGRGLVLRSGLVPGQTVQVSLTNSTAGPIVAAGAFVRAPEYNGQLSGGVANQDPGLVFKGPERGGNVGIVPPGRRGDALQGSALQGSAIEGVMGIQGLDAATAVDLAADLGELKMNPATSARAISLIANLRNGRTPIANAIAAAKALKASASGASATRGGERRTSATATMGGERR